ncbi:ABC transporter C family member 3 [Citrus sinensis]|uniref:ABC transporter C family member 3 n=1 Tax=Citrus sinensis TaxID=2711 RepID=A0ACB8MW53_CITSI|nr:ABC transporter C family member 3 [Citrus sinensis]KAH9789879.1 ABC transporter C family member 3 [Citrus sinensis]
MSECVTPYSNAGLFSIRSFSWMGSLIALGNKRTLDLEDVPRLDCSDSIYGVSPVLQNKLEAVVGVANRLTALRLAKVLFFSAWQEILFIAILALLYTLATYVGPYLIDNFVQYLNGRQAFEYEGYVLCLSERHWFFQVQQFGIRFRATLFAMIYNKGLTLSGQAKQGNTSGEIINLIAVDAERALLILYKKLGLASIATLLATAIVMLANFPLGRLREKFQDKFMETKDRRIKATSEILRNMRILKLQGWELKFCLRLLSLESNETAWLKKSVYTEAMISFFCWGAPTFVSVVTFGSCILLGIPLESGMILSALTTFKILQEPIYYLPESISMMIQAKVPLDRIASFLCLEGLQTDVLEKMPRGNSDTAIEIIDGSFSWDFSSPNPTLRNINLKVFHGMRVAVCGTVGSGKSSCLSCILGGVPKESGIIRLCGTKAYVAQSPWIQSGKIEENILFGKEMDRERYERVLEACSLKKDLEVLPFGDQTIIGERGINLSGGQKQRIQIARPLYQDADIFLLDDPFSPVDDHTGAHLFKFCWVSSSKTVIYATHQVEFLPAADLILVIKDGKITQAGKYSDILNSGTDFMELVGAHKQALSGLDSIDRGPVSERKSINKENDGTSTTNEIVNKEENKNFQSDDEAALPKGQLVQEEEREKGKVGFSVYWKYMTTAYGGVLVPFILLAQIIFQIFQIGSNYWMAWATPVAKDVNPAVGASTLIIVYVGAGYKTATQLFNKMHVCIFRAPMYFFDSTPSGRILNRVSENVKWADQSAADMDIPYDIGAFAFSMIQLLGIIVVMSLVAWQVLIVFVPVIATFIWYQQYYITSTRELSRLIGVCKAPVIQQFSETISGSTTIRSLDQELRFRDTNMKLIDEYSRPKFHIAGAMEWLRFCIDMLSSITFAFSLAFLISVPNGIIHPYKWLQSFLIFDTIAGLAVTYGLNLNMLQALKIISVERILQCACIPSEPALVIEATKPNNSRPSHGEVNIRHLQVRYAPNLPLVLRGLTRTLPGGTLFRIVESTAGHILIDGKDISLIGLHDLRTRLSIIPQDPTMFEGTTRSNLDPLEEHADEQIWEALDKCQLGDEVRKKKGKLDSQGTENGENWSIGQRQLVLVLDEATASVDTATDNQIQQTLRQHFSDCTVVTIAHRITSVLDSAMVLLLNHGLIKEYDSPTKLLENKSSSFAQLVAEYTSSSS